MAGNRASEGIGRRGKNPAKQLERTLERKLIEDVSQAAKERTAKALNTLESALNDEKCPWPSKITAAVALIDRGWGKPKEMLESTHTMTQRELVWSRRTVCRIANRVRLHHIMRRSRS